MDVSSLLPVFAKIYGKQDAELLDLLTTPDATDQTKRSLKPNFDEILLQLDTEKVGSIASKYKEEQTQYFDKGYQKAQAETLSKFEKNLAEKYGISAPDKKGIELIDLIVTEKAKASGKITDDTIKTHPVFLTHEKAIREKYEAELNQIKSEYEGFKQTIEKNQKFGKVKSIAESIFEKIAPVESQNPTVKQNRRQEFFGKFEQFDFQIGDNDSVVILKEGKATLCCLTSFGLNRL